MNKLLPFLICFIFGVHSLAGASEVQNINWAQTIVDQTVENMKQSGNVNDFDTLLAKKKKRKKRRKKRKSRRKKRKAKKPSRMAEQWTKSGRFYLEFNLGQISHGTLTAEEIQTQLNANVANYSAEDSSMGFSFGGGYYFKEWLAVEGAYSILGAEESAFSITSGAFNGNDVTVERTFSAIEINAKTIYWMGQKKQFGLYAKPGLMMWSLSVDSKFSVTTTQNSSESASGTSFTFGLGAEYYMGKKFYVGGGLMLYPSLGNDELGSQGHTKYLLSAGMLF